MTREEAIAHGKEQLNIFGGKHREFIEMAIKALEQESKTGHWIFTKTMFDRHGCTVECSSCHKKWKTYDEIRWKKENKYCPNCGSDNREVEE